MVRSGGEEEFKKSALKNAGDYAVDLNFWFFKRKIRNSGKEKGVVIEKPLFPGYVFMSAENFDTYLLEKISKSANYYHFLRDDKNITPLAGRDLDYIQVLVGSGETVGISKAKFDENDRIVILSGPLKGFKGNIIKVDRRKQRVTVRIDLCGNISSFDLSYDLVGNC